LHGASKFTYISPDYFKTMEITLLAGRDFNEFDTASSRKVAVVNETFVERFFADQNPIGAVIRSIAEPGYPETLYEVIGIVKDTKYSDLRDEIPPGTFIPATQHPAPRPGLVMAIRSSAPLKDVIAQIRNRLGTMSPELRVYFSIFEDQISQRLIQERLMAWLAGFFGALAAALAMIGLYGVISYMILKRRNELGIRLALGASRARIILLVLRETLRLLLIGLILGTIASVAVAKGAAALLFNLSPYDLPTLIISILSLALVAGLASYVPAWRASRVNPVVALRHD
jgi:predicted permease